MFFWGGATVWMFVERVHLKNLELWVDFECAWKRTTRSPGGIMQRHRVTADATTYRLLLTACKQALLFLKRKYFNFLGFLRRTLRFFKVFCGNHEQSKMQSKTSKTPF